MIITSTIYHVKLTNEQKDSTNSFPKFYMDYNKKQNTRHLWDNHASQAI